MQRAEHDAGQALAVARGHSDVVCRRMHAEGVRTLVEPSAFQVKADLADGMLSGVDELGGLPIAVDATIVDFGRLRDLADELNDLRLQSVEHLPRRGIRCALFEEVDEWIINVVAV